jgi:hypothetical protein
MKDLLDSGAMELVCVPTDELVADLLTKALNGNQLHCLLKKLIG